MRRLFVLAAFVGALSLLAGCSASSYDPCGPCAAHRAHPLGPIGPREMCGPCLPQPAGPCPTGCDPGCVPCRCWPTYPPPPATPARVLLAQIIAIANAELAACTTPACAACWQAAIQEANECATNTGNHALTPPTCHGMHRCDELYMHVQAALAAARAKNCQLCLCELMHRP